VIGWQARHDALVVNDEGVRRIPDDTRRSSYARERALVSPTLTTQPEQVLLASAYGVLDDAAEAKVASPREAHGLA
jgi:hypothetical protein